MEQHFNMGVGANAATVRGDAILLVEFGGGRQRHFNLPGGGVEPEESIMEGLRREVREETCAEIIVGSLLLVTEYFPPRFDGRFGSLHKLTLIFSCELEPGSEPQLPVRPDPNQVTVRWVPLTALRSEPLLPELTERLLVQLASPSPHIVFCDEP